LSDLEACLKGIESLLKNSFKDAIIWEQKGTNLVGKYVYMKYEQDSVGLFMGYGLDTQGRIKAGVTSIFPYASFSMWSDEVDLGRRSRSLYKILIRSNLKLKQNHYRIVTGGKLPAIIRTFTFKKEDTDLSNTSIRFFSESMDAIRQSQPVYKMIG